MNAVEIYAKARLKELEDMIAVYEDAGELPPIDLLARHAEVCRLQCKLGEYKEVQEKTDVVLEL